ncbi:MAG: hypothetical protein N2423_00480 [Novosphingobium sp.]|nr:hypothetical protein [Novosphingobium sp.]
MNVLGKAVAAATLAATVLVATAPAMARDIYRDGRGGETAAIAIGAGIVGIALGAIIASSKKRDRWDDRYHVGGGWYYNDNYYYNRRGQRYSHREWQRRYGDRYRSWRGDWNRGYRGDGDRWDRDDRRRGYGDGYYDRRGY